MEVLTVLLAFISIIILYYSQQLLALWTYYKKAKKLPTELPNPIFGHLLEYLGPRNQMMAKVVELAKTTGVQYPAFTIWLGTVPVLFVLQAKYLEILLGSPKYIYKEFPYQFLRPWLGDGLLNSSGEKWHNRRKMLTPAFHFTILENFVEVFSEKCRILVKKLQKEVGSKEFDIFPYVNLCALDIICQTAMGTDMNAQEDGEHSEYVAAVEKITHEVMERTLSPWLHPNLIFNYTPSGRRTKKYLETLHRFTNQVINDRKRVYRQQKQNKESIIEEDDIGKKKRSTFLDLLLECADKDNSLTHEDIREEVDTFMFEGHDTTTMGIAWALQMLALHPEIQEKVYEEVESIMHDPEYSPTMKELNEMKYLERVIKESLRLYPSVPMFARQLLEDIELDGMIVPAGMRIAFLPLATHRNPEYYPDPDTFNPDNFLPERIAKRHPYAYFPFSAGPRNCIGQKFALLEEKMMIASIVRHYKLEATGEAPTGLPDLILRPENGVHVKIVPRSQ